MYGTNLKWCSVQCRETDRQLGAITKYQTSEQWAGYAMKCEETGICLHAYCGGKLYDMNGDLPSVVTLDDSETAAAPVAAPERDEAVVVYIPDVREVRASAQARERTAHTLDAMREVYGDHDADVWQADDLLVGILNAAHEAVIQWERNRAARGGK